MSSSSSSAPDLSTTVAGLRLTSCVYNASGPRSGTAAALHKVALSGSGAVLTKSATLLKQDGNPLPRTYHAPDNTASFNSEGLPNNGIDYYIAAETVNEAMQGVKNSKSKNNKPYIVSLSGKCLQDNIEMLQRTVQAAQTVPIDAMELNLACPNVIGKPIIGYDFEQMDTILTAVGQTLQQLRQTCQKVPPLGVKLPPYFDFSHFQRAADVLNRHHASDNNTVQYVVTINTIGNALSIDGAVAEAPFIRSNDGFAGSVGRGGQVHGAGQRAAAALAAKGRNRRGGGGRPVDGTGRVRHAAVRRRGLSNGHDALAGGSGVL